MYKKGGKLLGACLLYLYCRTDMIKELLHTDVQQLLVYYFIAWISRSTAGSE